jgi:hypothetical protein
VELHGRLFARPGLDQLDRQAFERPAAGCHPLTGQRPVTYTVTMSPHEAHGDLAGL